MELFEWGNNPWGQEILIRISMDILYLCFWAGVAFILFHLVYAAVWVDQKVAAHLLRLQEFLRRSHAIR